MPFRRHASATLSIARCSYLGALLAAGLLLASGVLIRRSAVAQPTELDFRIEATTGVYRTLRSERGRVVVVFFEDRDHVRDNHDFKLAFHRFLETNGIDDEVTAYAVANVSGIGGFVQDIARSVIRSAAEDHEMEILMDWEGVLLSPPFSLADDAANVALIDRTGRLAWRHSGPVDDDSRREFYRQLRRALRGNRD